MSQIDLPVGSVLRQRYKILSTLGKGGFARVYLARDANWKGNLVALKEIRTEGFTPEEYQSLNAHFLQEAAFLMGLEHPGLPRVVEFFAEGSRYYLAMEWIAGKTLEEIVREKGPVEEVEALEWGIQIADVLTYLHRHEPYPVVLGDMKPSNVMRDFNGAIKVVDFGVARYLAPSHNPRTFSLVSPGFSAPEQFTRFEVDTRSDIYALGATLYWVLTGVSLERYKFAIPPIRRVRSNISQLTEYVLGRCLKREPGERYVRASAVREELAKILAELQRKEKERQEQSSPDQILSALYERKRRLEGD